MGKYLDFYRKCIDEKSCNFLCHEFASEMYGKEDNPFFALFIPNEQELDRHYQQGYGRVAWGVKASDSSRLFSTLRQNIILFMAAMNNEDFNELKR